MSKMTILGEEIETGTDPDPNTPDPAQNTDDKSGDSWLAQLVGEGRKYKSAEEVAKAYAHVEDFAETLKKEKSDLEKQLMEEKEQRSTMKELIEELRGVRTPTQQSPKQEEAKPDVDINQLVSQSVQTMFAQREKEATEKAAEQRMWSLLDDKFNGRDNAKALVRSYVSENETRADLIKLMGMTDPDGLVELLQANAKQDQYIPPAGESKQNVSFNAVANGLTWKKAQQIKKDNPKLYWSREFQSKMHRAANENPKFMEE